MQCFGSCLFLLLFSVFWSDSHKCQCLSKLAQWGLSHVCIYIWKATFQKNLLQLWELFHLIGRPIREGLCQAQNGNKPLFKGWPAFYGFSRVLLGPTLMTQNDLPPVLIVSDPKPRRNLTGLKPGWRQNKRAITKWEVLERRAAGVCMCVHSTGV